MRFQARLGKLKHKHTCCCWVIVKSLLVLWLKTIAFLTIKSWLVVIKKILIIVVSVFQVMLWKKLSHSVAPFANKLINIAITCFGCPPTTNEIYENPHQHATEKRISNLI